MVRSWGSEGVPDSVMIVKPFFPPQIITALPTLLNQQHPTASNGGEPSPYSRSRRQLAVSNISLLAKLGVP